MKMWLVLVFCIMSLLIVSGCTQTGKVTGGEQNLTPEEEQILEEFLNKTPVENVSPIKDYEGHTEPQNITQPLGCPETCDNEDNCTYDYCSEYTNYECVHAMRICPSFVKICPDGVRVICENTCIDDACTRCKPDCTEHQLPVCELTQDDCGACQILDTENCECAQIISCVNNDGCCSEGCDYINDNDCEEPDGECSEDMDCNDDNNCTIDKCEGIPKNCSHENITPCCGNGECEDGENFESCPDDCEEEEIFNITITNLDPVAEWVEIGNFGSMEVDMTNWTINDTLVTPKKRFTFPEFILQPYSYVFILKGPGEDNSTHLYRNKLNIWNNDGDAAVLIDNAGQIISQYNY